MRPHQCSQCFRSLTPYTMPVNIRTTGCLGSIVLSIVLTVVLNLLLRACSG